MTILVADHLNWEFSDGCTMTHESIDGSWVMGQFLCYIDSSILDTTLTMCLIEIVYRGAQLFFCFTTLSEFCRSNYHSFAVERISPAC